MQWCSSQSFPDVSALSFENSWCRVAVPVRPSSQHHVIFGNTLYVIQVLFSQLMHVSFNFTIRMLSETPLITAKKSGDC